MNCWRFMLLLWLALPGTATAAANDASAFAVRLPVEFAPGQSLQRIELPPKALIALQSPDLADLRVFDAKGRTLSVARIGATATAPLRHMTTIKALPIIGVAGTLNISGVTLRIDDRQQARVVAVEGAIDAAAPQRTVVLGSLFDTRAVTGRATGLALDADVPAQQPVTFTVAASDDLRSWQVIADKVIYRTSDHQAPESTETIPLSSIALKGRYLLVTWHAATQLVRPILVRGATLTTTTDGAPTRMIGVDVLHPVLEDAHTVSFAQPFGTPVAAIRVTPAGANALVPLRVLGRNDRDQPWTLLATGTAYTLVSNGKTVTDDRLALSGPTFRTIRIEADARTSGFAGVPKIQLQFEPVQIVVLVAGVPPFTLAAGLAGTPNAYLPIHSLVPGYRAGNESALPLVKFGASGAASLSGDGPDQEPPLRQIALWALLLLGTTVLGAMVWILLRSGKPEQ